MKADKELTVLFQEVSAEDAEQFLRDTGQEDRIEEVAVFQYTVRPCLVAPGVELVYSNNTWCLKITIDRAMIKEFLTR